MGYLTWTSRSFSVVALISFVVLYVSVPQGVDNWVLVVNLVAFYLIAFRALALRDSIVDSIPTPLTINVLYLFISYLIFYYPYQQYLLGASDLSGGDLYHGRIFLDGSNAAITLSTVGTLAFTIGYDIVRDVRKPTNVNQPPTIHVDGTKEKLSPSPYFVGLSIAAFALLVLMVGAYLSLGWRSAGEGRYTNSTAAATLGVEGVYLATSTICMLVCALWVYGKANFFVIPPVLQAGLALTIFWTVRLLVFGDRNTVQLVILALAGGYYTFVRRPSGYWLIAAAVAGLTVYNFLEVARETPDWYLPSRFVAVLQNPEAFRSLGGQSSLDLTTISLRATVEAVPSTFDYGYGVAKLIHIVSIVPFAGQTLVPYLRPEYLSSSAMIHDIMVGGHGDFSPGTNVISDAYIDFGLFGVILTPFLIGIFAKLIRNYVATDPRDLQRFVIYLVAMPLFAQLPRYSIESLLRPLAWTFVFTLVVGVTATGPRRRRDVGNVVKDYAREVGPNPVRGFRPYGEAS